MKTMRRWVAGALLAGLAAGCSSSSSSKPAPAAPPKGAEQKSVPRTGLENPPPP